MPDSLPSPESPNNYRQSAAASDCATDTTAVTPDIIRSATLLDQHGMLRIEHKGAIYTLRATSKGGLILTK